MFRLLNIIVIAGLMIPLIFADPLSPCTVTSVQHSYREFGLGNVISTLVAASSPDPLATIHWDALPNVSCSCSPRTATSVALIGEYARAFQTTPIGSLLSWARAQEQDVLSLCPSSAYARWRRGEVLDVSQELVALEMRKHPHHGGGISHGDVCDGVLHPSAMFKTFPSRFSSLVFDIPMDIVRWMGSWVVPSASWYESVLLTALHVLRKTAAVVTEGEYVYSVVRGLSMEDVTVRVTNVTLLESVFIEQGDRAMLQHVQKYVHLYTFPPTTPSPQMQRATTPSDASCDLNAMLLLEDTHSILRYYSIVKDRSVRQDDSNIGFALFRQLIPSPTLVTPLCRVQLAHTNSTKASSLEGAVSHHAGLEALWRLFQQRGSSAAVLSHVSLDIHKEHESATTASPAVVSFDVICRIERRYLEDPVCLGVQGAAGLVNSTITITSTLRFDLLWWYLFLAMVAVTVLRRLERALFFSLGAVMKPFMAIFVVMREGLDKVGAIVLIDPVSISEYLMVVVQSSLISLVTLQILGNSIGHEFLVLEGVLFAVLSRMVFGSITRAVLAAVKLLLLACMVVMNEDATIVVVVGLVALNLRLFLKTIVDLHRRGWWLSVCPVIAFVTIMLGNRGDSNNDASDRVLVHDPNLEASFHLLRHGHLVEDD